MKKLLFAGLAALVLSTTGCGFTTIEPGHVGVKINRWGSDRGVANIPYITGMVVYNPLTTSVFEYPTYVQNYAWTAGTHDGGSKINEEFSFQSKDNVIVKADVSIGYQLAAEKVPHFYVKFRNDDLDAFTHGYLRNEVRASFTGISENFTTEEMTSTKQNEFLADVQKKLAKRLEPLGISIEQFGFVSGIRLPQAMQEAINAKVAATQRAQQIENEVRAVKAEAEKNVAKAKGEAEANSILTASISDKLIQWRNLEIMSQKWNGALPLATSGGVMLQLPITH